jgi:hypothetical protein
MASTHSTRFDPHLCEIEKEKVTPCALPHLQASVNVHGEMELHALNDEHNVSNEAEVERLRKACPEDETLFGNRKGNDRVKGRLKVEPLATHRSFTQAFARVPLLYRVQLP